MKASTCNLVVLGERMKLAREHLALTQTAFSEQFGWSVRSYQKNEAGSNEAGICLAAAFIRAGINANWLLTGEGPMLLAGLVAPVAAPPSVKINRGALAALLRGAIALTAQGMSIEAAADMAADMYQRAMEEGQITPDGIGEGSLGNAA